MFADMGRTWIEVYMPLRGNLRDFSTTQLLNLINLARKTGTLTIEGPNEAARMTFREGKLIFAQVGHEEPTLTVILRRAGKLNDEQARALKQRPEAANDKALGLLLINAGYVTQTEILHGIRQHITAAGLGSVQYDPTQRDAYAWWAGQFMEGFADKFNDLPREDRALKTIVILAERGGPKTPASNDVI